MIPFNTTMQRFRKRTAMGMLAMTVMTIMACTVSCNKDDSGTPPPASEQYYTLAAWADEPQYLASAPSLTEGTLSFVGNGLEAEGSRYLWHKNYVYLMNLPQKRFIQYELGTDGSITEKAYILTDGVVPNYFQSLNVVDDNTLLVLGAVDGNRGTAGWARIKVPEFEVVDKGTLEVPFDEANPGVEFFVGRGYADNGHFILGGYFYDNASGAYASDGVKALVYDYPAMTNMRVIQTDVTSGGIGYDYLSSLDTDEAGNHYFVASAGKYWTGNGGNSGIVRIKKGETQFDPDYFFDVTSQVGRAACLMGINYVGDGIAFGTVQYEELMTHVRDRLQNVGQVVKLDLVNKIATVMNTPLSPVAMVRSPLVQDGKYYTALCIADGEAALYEFDPSGGADSFKKGLALDAGGWVQVQLIAPHPAN
ncbi:DUF4374 domain-containing protein [Parapedobacter koreensis]|uniref:DUF4374 domain-containing protein n=1 Tax=Parapedobacter koreensis TaxID=332977 RepID=A0A1H7EWK1_9SPHI|nr:DUF4374 domain-containing protein [Parapedobacter koreensis]SEK17994.1 protein of unknown function [Parapedobacter koreensis]